MISARVLVTVASRSTSGDHYRITLDLPRATWSLEDLHELAREVASTAVISGETTAALNVEVAWPDGAGLALEPGTHC